MNTKKPAARRVLKSDLAKADAHRIKPDEYEELPQLTGDMLARATVNKGGEPLLASPGQQLPQAWQGRRR